MRSSYLAAVKSDARVVCSYRLGTARDSAANVTLDGALIALLAAGSWYVG